MTDPLDTIVFVSLPEDFAQQVGTLHIGPEVLLPVDTGGSPQTWNPSELTWEMVIAGMIKVLAWNPEHEDAAFYRRFVAETRPEVISDLTQAGVVQANNDNFEIAEEIFRGISGLNPQGLDGPVNLALVKERRADNLRVLGREDDADQLLEEAAEIYRDILQRDVELPPDLHLNAGLFFLKIQNFDLGISELDQFIQGSDDPEKIQKARLILQEIDSQHTQDRLFKEAFDFIRMGREEKGIASIRVFLEKNPETWNGWFMLGWGLRRLQRFDEAATAFRKAIDLGGDTADTLNELAICEIETGNLEDAYTALDDALRKDPDNVRIMSNFGVLYLKKDLPDEARRFFETVLALEPDDQIARQFLESLD